MVVNKVSHEVSGQPSPNIESTKENQSLKGYDKKFHGAKKDIHICISEKAFQMLLYTPYEDAG
ncbi:7904_t:CDS:2 [Dentiscutata heterogama]|uniref:7904_t:CDS:1 n=1 Tax=Dentiscutata heterogama TaxID=1316150 RepID=A0ACA9NP65_9GLOM|nr:7904_t:CDS:2 [Dentiscutata heterogama]